MCPFQLCRQQVKQLIADNLHDQQHGLRTRRLDISVTSLNRAQALDNNCWPDVHCSSQLHYFTLGVRTVASPAAGHTSWTTSGMAYLSFWAAGKLRCFNGRGHPWRLVVSGGPTGLAAWVGFTRLQASWPGSWPHRLALVAHCCPSPPQLC